MTEFNVIDLGDVTITAAITGQVITDGLSSAGAAQSLIDRLAGMLGLSVEFRFIYGAGGTTCKAWLQTSLDQGATWIDIACAAFTTANGTKVFNLSGLTPKTTPVTPTDGALADDTCVDGILGDRLRVKATTTGVYAASGGTSTALSVRAVPR